MAAALDPYAELGVPRDAATGDGRKAYRRKAKAAHPDAGGSIERFERLKLAHDVLVNAERRAKYDHTGSVEDVVDLFQAQVMELLASALDHALGQAGKAYLETDLVARMRQHLE